MPRPARALAVAVTVAAALLVGGCQGGGDHAARPTARTAASERRPGASPTVTTPAAFRLTAVNFTDVVGAASAEKLSYDFTMSIDSADRTIKGTGSASLGSSGVKISVKLRAAFPGTARLVLAGGKTYVSVSTYAAGRFFQVGATGSDAGAAGAGGGLPQQLGGLTAGVDPSSQLQQLRGAIVSVTKAGTAEVIDGVQTQPYAVVVETTKVIGSLSSALGELGKLPPTLTYFYWIGSDSLIHRSAADISGNHIEATFSHWGAGAPVVVPAADQLVASPF